MRGKKGSRDVFYNGQVVLSNEQFVLHNHISTSSSDKQQLIPCLEGLEKNTGSYPDVGIFDSGYASFVNDTFAKEENIDLYIPDQEFGKTNKNKPYYHTNFQYDPEIDIYICPKGKQLSFYKKGSKNGFSKRIYRGNECESCPVRHLCTAAKARTIQRDDRQYLRDEMNYKMITSKGQAFYNKRRHKVEPIFGHLKYNLGYQHFFLRGQSKVTAEFNLFCIAYNLIRMMNSKLKLTFGKLTKIIAVFIRQIFIKLNLIVKELIFNHNFYTSILLRCIRQ